MEVARKQRQVYFMRVSKNCKLLTELYIIQSDDCPQESWFEDRHLQEILLLLRDPIKVKVVSYYEQLNRQRRSKTGNKESKKKGIKEEPEILTGESVKIGYKFAESNVHYNSCLMPTEIGAPVWLPEDDERHAGGGFSYARLFPKKLVVHVCEYRTAAAAVSATSQLMKSLSATPPSKNLAISSYFPRKSDPDFVEPNFAHSAARKRSKLRKIVKEMKTEPDDLEERTRPKEGLGGGGGFMETKQEPADSQTTSEEIKTEVEPVVEPDNGSEGGSSDVSSSDDIPCSLSTRLNAQLGTTLLASVKEANVSDSKMRGVSCQEHMERRTTKVLNHQNGGESLLKNVAHMGGKLGESDASNRTRVSKQNDVEQPKAASRDTAISTTSPNKGLDSATDSERITRLTEQSTSGLKKFVFKPLGKKMKRSTKLSLKKSKNVETVEQEVEEKEESAESTNVLNEDHVVWKNQNTLENTPSEHCVLEQAEHEPKETSSNGTALTCYDSQTNSSSPLKDFHVDCPTRDKTKEKEECLGPRVNKKLSLRHRTLKGKQGPSRKPQSNMRSMSSSSDEGLMTTSFLRPVVTLRRSPAASRHLHNLPATSRLIGGSPRSSDDVPRTSDGLSSDSLPRYGVGLPSEGKRPDEGRSLLLPAVSLEPENNADGESTSDYGAKEMLSPSSTERNIRLLRDAQTRSKHSRETSSSRLSPRCESKGTKKIAKKNNRPRRPTNLEGLLNELGWDDEDGDDDDDLRDVNVGGARGVSSLENAAKTNLKRNPYLPLGDKTEEPVKGLKRKKDQTDDDDDDDNENMNKIDKICSPSRKVHKLLEKMDNIIDNGVAVEPADIVLDISDLESDGDEEGSKATAEGRGADDGKASSGQRSEGQHEVIDLSQGDDEDTDSDHWFDSIFGDIRYVRELKEEDIQFLTKKNKNYFKSIFMGKRVCERHQCYKQKGPKRLNMATNVRLGPFREEHMDTVMGELVKIYCSKHFKYMDYISKVLLPEALTKIYMDVHGVNHTHAEEVMRGQQKEQARK